MRRTVAMIVGLVAGTGSLLWFGSVAEAADPVAGTAPAAAVATDPALLPEDLPTVVEPGEDTLHEAVEEAEPGDTLVLEPGLYLLTHTVLIEKDLTIRGATSDPQDVHIVGVREDFDLLEGVGDADPLDWGHLLFAREPAEQVFFGFFTIKGAPEVEAITDEVCEGQFGLIHGECNGDGIHTDGVDVVEVEDVAASLNAGNGIWIDGAKQATLDDIVGVGNGAFGIDVDTALELSIDDSTFTGNHISGIEASGHPLGVPRSEYQAKAKITDTVARGNGEIGVEVERFRKATIEHVTCVDNFEDGFDADRVGTVKMRHNSFINNLDDAIELFPVGVAPEEQPADFPGSIVEDFDGLDFAGNVGQEINHAPTEN